VDSLVGGPGQVGELGERKPVPHVGVVLGDDAHPPVAVQFDGRQITDHPVGHEQAVDGTQEPGRVLRDLSGHLAEGEPDTRGLLVNYSCELRAEDRDGVVGSEDGEVSLFPCGVEPRLAGEDAF